jgi:hypothetical protein
MSGMFQRIARRNADRPDEPGAAETAGNGAETVADTPEAPTERIEPVAPATEPPATDVPATTTEAAAAEQPTTLQPVAPPAPAAPAAPATQAAETPPAEAQPAAEAAPAEPAPPRRPGFRARGRMRRRLRYLRKLREIQVRDLGGLVFDLRRFERKRDDLVAQKIDHIRACDDELRALEIALGERRELRDVHEPGIGGTCPRCFAVFGSADRFCSNCGVALGGAVQGPAQVAPAPPPPAASPQQPEAPAKPPAATPPADAPSPAAPPAPGTPPPAGGPPS